MRATGRTGGRSVQMTALAGVPMVMPGDDLGALLIDALERNEIAPVDDDVIVIAQKIVSKAEGRYVSLCDIVPSARAQALALEVDKDPRIVEVILSESNEVVRHRKGVLIVAHRLGFVMANGGVDQSNIEHGAVGAVGAEGGEGGGGGYGGEGGEGGGKGEERVLLLPHDPDASCIALKTRLDAAFGADIGVIINDSFGRPWRNGVVGVALGCAGVPALESRIGRPDLFGRPLRVTEIAVADEIAAAASMLMGQADEGLPVVHLRGLRWDASIAKPMPASALLRPKAMDMFR